MSRFTLDRNFVSWGRVVRAPHVVARPSFRDELPALVAEGRDHAGKLLAVGLGRSYGTSGLNADGALIVTPALDRLLDFDPATGLLRAEAGISLAQILAFVVPRGFFLPVTPGTKFVTLGGAVANDIHGKNHSPAGTIGRWITRLGLLRSDGVQLELTPADQTGLFAATIGGLGLTGVITDVSLQLKQIPSAYFDVETISFGHVSEFFSLTEESLVSHDYTVAWIDCFAEGAVLGRGLFTRANFCQDGALDTFPAKGPSIPLDLPEIALNKLSISAFNVLYYGVGRMKPRFSRQHYDKLLYPLDKIAQWNRLYGRRGLYQYQSVVPPADAAAVTAEMLKVIAKGGQGSFLIVLKTFGALTSPGMLSFPREGTTLALDFPNRGESTLKILDRLDAIVEEAGGRLYPAKDGRMPPRLFRAGYPGLEEFSRHVDSAFTSTFWRRLGDPP